MNSNKKKYITYVNKDISKDVNKNYIHIQTGGNNLKEKHKGIICELIHINVDKIENYNEKFKDLFDISNISKGFCDDSKYDEYHINYDNLCNCSHVKVELNQRKPFKFKNSLSTYFDDLLKYNIMKKIGEFTVNSGNIIVCGRLITDEDFKSACIPKKVSNGIYNTYFIKAEDHWNKDIYETEWEWCGAALIIHNKFNISDLDNLDWHQDILYAHGAAGVFDFGTYGKEEYLDPDMLSKAKKTIGKKRANDFIIYIDEIYMQKQKSGQKIKYLMVPTGASFFFEESRPRNFIYGTDQNNITRAILLHSLC